MILYAPRRQFVATPFALAAVLLAAACSGTGGTRQERPDVSGFTPIPVHAGPFELFALRRDTPSRGTTITIYIEGDGRAFRHRNRVSGDPTPGNPVAMALARRDPDPDVAYLARPCQFQPAPPPAPCEPSLWSTARYGETVVAAVATGVDSLAAGYAHVVLVGYSGGGTLAVLVAARRNDVIGIITLAANLDHVAWTDLHGVSPLEGSMNAADVARAVQAIPQAHYAGERDTVVPPDIGRVFMQRMDTTSRATFTVVPGFDHECCWAEQWPRMIAEARALLQKY